MIDVSVLIVCWNSDRLIYDCLNSIYHFTQNFSFEVIAVDNGSADKTVEIIRQDFPDVKLIKAGVNLGFARANNLALSLAQGEYILLLNPDTCFKSDVIGELVRFLKEHPNAGCVGPKILEKNGSVSLFEARQPPTLSSTAFIQFGLRKLFPKSRFFAKEHLPDWDRSDVREIPSIGGAALMMPQSVFHRIGWLSNEIPMYFEDLDLCARIRAAGKHIYLVPSAVLLHLGGMSSELSPARPLLFAMENGQAPWLYFQKYGRSFDSYIFTMIILIGSLLRLPIFILLLLISMIKTSAFTHRIANNITKSWALLLWSFSKKKSYAKRLSGVFSDGTNVNFEYAFHELGAKETVDSLSSNKKLNPEEENQQ